MKLEIGKYYRDANGHKRGPVLHGEGFLVSYHHYEGSRGPFMPDGKSWTGSDADLIAEWGETPRVDRYDLKGIKFKRCGQQPSSSFLFGATPEGQDWWWKNQDTSEGQARLEQMRRQWDEENGVQDRMSASDDDAPDAMDDVQPTIATRITLEDQTINGVTVEDGVVYIEGLTDATELRQAATVLVLIADKLEEQ